MSKVAPCNPCTLANLTHQGTQFLQRTQNSIIYLHNNGNQFIVRDPKITKVSRYFIWSRVRCSPATFALLPNTHNTNLVLYRWLKLASHKGYIFLYYNENPWIVRGPKITKQSRYSRWRLALLSTSLISADVVYITRTRVL